MYVKVENSGVCERKGLVQVRLAMYLDKDDYGYEKHHVELPVIPEGGYESALDERGQPKDMVDYQKWLDGLPKSWQVNPFHNHFIYIEPGTTDNEIMDMAEAFLKESYATWQKDETPTPKNTNVNFKTSPSESELSACNAKVQYLKETELIRIPTK